MAGDIHSMSVGCGTCAHEARRQARRARAEAAALTDPESWEARRDLEAKARAADRTAELFEIVQELAT